MLIMYISMAGRDFVRKKAIFNHKIKTAPLPRFSLRVSQFLATFGSNRLVEFFNKNIFSVIHIMNHQTSSCSSINVHMCKCKNSQKLSVGK